MKPRRRCGSWILIGALIGCLGVRADNTPHRDTNNDTDVIVIGGGIAGLSAALEASALGARVLVVEAASVAGGHAVKAGGFALVGTPLQIRKGFVDSPESAFRDLMTWGEDPDPVWVRYFVDHARTDIHDWLTGFGVRFTVLLDTPEDTVPRFHFAGGTAVNVIVPMLRAAAGRDNLQILHNTEAVRLAAAANDRFTVTARNLRDDRQHTVDAASVVIATGGFQSNLDLVRAHFRAGDATAPARLLIGSGRRANGDGLRLGAAVGARLVRLDRQVIFVDGLADPREPQRGLKVDNPAAIRIDAQGLRFVDETAPSRDIETAVLSLREPRHWLVFDARGRKRLRVRGAVWLDRDTTAAEILNNPAVVPRGASIRALAAAAGLPADALQATVDRHNLQAAANSGPAPLTRAPFYAMPLWPMTRKSMGGLQIDTDARVIGSDAAPIDGLFAAGEATGVAGINGRHGGSGTFLAPSVLTGRVAGRHAADYARAAPAAIPEPGYVSTAGSMPMPAADGPVATNADALRRELAIERPGYWHWERSHRIVLERTLACTDCHSTAWPTTPATTRTQTLLRLTTCSRCH